jgi:DNA repair exonuclease SbcCD ATPase subunit
MNIFISNRNLDDITRNIYKENVQLTESFKLNTQEIESLRKQNKALTIENEKLRGESEGNSALVREKVDLASKQAKHIKELQSKVEILEKSLSQVVREFEIERTNIIKKCKLELESSTTELEKLQKMMEMKNKEMNKVKKLAKNILEQRSEIERFFLESLDYVKKQIVTNR